MSALIQFLFVLVLPFVLVLGGLVSLFAVGALFMVLDDPSALKSLTESVERVFKPRAVKSQPAPPDHYYKAYWSR
jgi:hypothetical protein